MNLPTKITLLRFLIIPFGVTSLFLENLPYNYEIAMVLFLVAQLTDIIDGFIARKYKLTTKFGNFLDALADRVIMVLYILFLTFKAVYPLWLIMIFIARELIVDGFRTYSVSLNIYASFGVGIVILGKIKAVLQTVSIISGILYLMTSGATIGSEIWSFLLFDIVFYSLLLALLINIPGLVLVFHKNFYKIYHG